MVGHDHEDPTVTEGTVKETVTYNNASSQQVDGLTDVSQYCYQPIKYDCYNTHVSQWTTLAYHNITISQSTMTVITHM